MKARPIVFLAVLASVVLATTAVWAAIPGTDGTINGCYRSNNGQLRVIDSAGQCATGEQSLSWNHPTRIIWGTKTPTDNGELQWHPVNPPLPPTGSLSLPAGSWLITATVVVTDSNLPRLQRPDFPDINSAICSLTAGGITSTSQQIQSSANSNPDWPGVAKHTLTLQIAATLADPGLASVGCGSLFFFFGRWEKLTITAIEATSATQQTLG